MEPSNKIVMIKVSELTNHPTADQVPMVPEDHAEAKALRASIAEEGIVTPLHCDTQHRVFEGRHRLRAARALRIDEVPCIIEAEEVAATSALHTALARRHFSPGQRAIVIMGLHARNEEERRARKLQNLRKGSKPTQIPEAHGAQPESGVTVSAVSLAEKYGVSRDMLLRAERLLTTVGPKAEAAVRRVMSGEIELGAAVAGLRGGEATEGKKKGRHDYRALFIKNFKSFARFGKHFDKIERTADRNDVIEAAEKMPLVLPEELLKALARGIKAARQEAR